jgi:hypothetical protein
MKVTLPNQDAGTQRLYIGDVMAEEYEPPGPEVYETSDGTRYVRVTRAVGEQLVDDYDFGELADEKATADDSSAESGGQTDASSSQSDEETTDQSA